MQRQAPRLLPRLASYLLTLWIVLTANFLLPRLLPGDPLAALLDPQNSDYVFDAEVRASLEAYYGLDRSLPVQYARYLAGAITGDLGRSIRLNQPVGELIRTHLPWTLLLTLTALTLASLLGVWSGAAAAWKRGSFTDRGLAVVSVVIGNTPVYFVGMMLLILFGAWLGWLPLAGGRTPFAHYDTLPAAIADVGRHLLLPALTLTLAMVGAKFLLVRNSMVGVLGEDFMLVARAKGLSASRLKWAHALRNAILPFVAHLAAHASTAITGAVFIETLFNYPGMGRLIFEAVGARDYPVIQGVFLVVSTVVLAANLLADWLNARLDPRLREA
jgi:peptide/nickel transport system permease protein